MNAIQRTVRTAPWTLHRSLTFVHFSTSFSFSWWHPLCDSKTITDKTEELMQWTCSFQWAEQLGTAQCKELFFSSPILCSIMEDSVIGIDCVMKNVTIISRYQMSCLSLQVEIFWNSLSFFKAKWPAKPLFIILLDISNLTPFQNYPAASRVPLHFPKLAPISICYRRPGLGKISVLSFHKIQPVSDCVPYLISHSPRAAS